MKRPNKKPVSIYYLNHETGFDPRTIRKRLIDAGLFPPQRHPLAKLLAALKSQPETRSDEYKKKKQFEDWRKVKLANDEFESKLVEWNWISERIRTLCGRWRSIVQQKFVNEAPARLAGQDVASVREILRTITDETDAEIAALSVIFADEPKKE